MLNETGVQYHVVELDTMTGHEFTGAEVQSALATATGTVATEIGVHGKTIHWS